MKNIFKAVQLFFSDRSKWVSLYFRQEDRWVKAMLERDKEIDKWKTELYKLVAVLTDGTWKEGDSIIETIDAFQEEKHLAVHRDAFIHIMMQNQDPEDAAQELFEYFGITDNDGVLVPKE